MRECTRKRKLPWYLGFNLGFCRVVSQKFALECELGVFITCRIKRSGVRVESCNV